MTNEEGDWLCHLTAEQRALRFMSAFFKMQHTDKSATHLNLRALQVCFYKIYVYVINIKTIFVRSLFTL